MRKFNFGSGRPDPASFPAAALAEAAARILPEVGRELVNYPDGKGHVGLREIVAMRYERRESVPLAVDEIVLTTGSMQAIELITETFARPGEIVITEAFTYSGSLAVFRNRQARLVGIPLDEKGMIMEELEAILQRLIDQGTPPKFIYTISNHQNPTGSILPVERRHRLLELAQTYQVLIVDDNCYGDILFDQSQAVPSLYTLDEGASVIYVASFSKILGPGVRLGYFVAPQPLLSQILDNKQDGGTNALASMIVAEYFKDHLWSHIAETNAIVQAKRDTMLEALAEHFSDLGDEVHWSRPPGGLFIWVRIPTATDTRQAYKFASEQGVVYGPGQAFSVAGEDVPYLRLAYGFPALDDIQEGIPRLAECLHRSQP